jgi:hypothetical protein
MKRLIASDDSQRGAVLLVTMMILLILTVLGVAAISTTTSELRNAGNAKLQNTVFYGADGGGRTTIPILKSSLDNRIVPAGPPVQDPNLLNEIMGYTPNDGTTDSPVNNPDIKIMVGGITVGVDIDRLQSHGSFSAGGALEFASGYEGVGVGMSGGGGGIGFYFGVNSVGGIGQSGSHIYQEYTHFLR